MTSVFPSALKTTKVVPVFKKDSKLDYNNYRPISLLSNVEKILEKLMYKRLYTFLKNNNVIYNLQFGFGQQYSTSHALIGLSMNILCAGDKSPVQECVLKTSADDLLSALRFLGGLHNFCNFVIILSLIKSRYVKE